MAGNRRDFLRIAIFLACLAFFIERGPYRAIRYSTTGDFSTVYAAARCWIHGGNPYERACLKTELASAGAPAEIERNQDVNPSVYLPAAMPWAALIGWLPWMAANVTWCLLSVALFTVSLRKILEHTGLPRAGQWLAASAALLFSPTYVGVYDGNPSVISISLVALSICLGIRGRPLPDVRGSEEAMGGSTVVSGILAGIALSFKPQIAMCALCLFAVWRRWSPITIGAAVFAGASVAGVVVVSHFGRDWSWLQAEQRNVALSFELGGQSDPRPESAVAWQFLNAQTLVSYLVRDRRACDAAVWVFAAAMTAAFLYGRTRAARVSQWNDAAFFATLALILTYHRYYDAQILLLLMPLMVQWWNERRRFAVMALGICLAILAFPLQSVFARGLGPAATQASWTQFLLLRNQPVAVLAILALLSGFKLRAETET